MHGVRCRESEGGFRSEIGKEESERERREERKREEGSQEQTVGEEAKEGRERREQNNREKQLRAGRVRKERGLERLRSISFWLEASMFDDFTYNFRR